MAAKTVFVMVVAYFYNDETDCRKRAYPKFRWQYLSFKFIPW